MLMNAFSKWLALSAILFCTSCVVYGGVPQKLDNFVTATENDCQNYSKEEWEKSRKEYRSILDEYKNSKKEFTQEEREMAIRAMGRYNALLLKNGIVESAVGIREFSAMVPDFLRGMAEGLDAHSEEINQALKSLVDTNKLKGAIDQIGSALSKMFAGLDE